MLIPRNNQIKKIKFLTYRLINFILHPTTQLSYKFFLYKQTPKIKHPLDNINKINNRYKRLINLSFKINTLTIKINI